VKSRVSTGAAAAPNVVKSWSEPRWMAARRSATGAAGSPESGFVARKASTARDSFIGTSSGSSPLLAGLFTETKQERASRVNSFYRSTFIRLPLRTS
jgi:hypothetical protein